MVVLLTAVVVGGPECVGTLVILFMDTPAEAVGGVVIGTEEDC